MTLDPVTTLYFLLIGGNLVLIVDCLYCDRLRIKLCRFALWANGIILAIAVFGLICVLNKMRTSAEAGILLQPTLIAGAPFLAAFLAFAAIYRWRMRQQVGPPGK